MSRRIAVVAATRGKLSVKLGLFALERGESQASGFARSEEKDKETEEEGNEGEEKEQKKKQKKRQKKKKKKNRRRRR
nr:hypothetical protein BaRGS_026451 [Batillaria attramentaria]